MDTISKRRYTRYKRNNKKSKAENLTMDFDEEAKFKLERFLDDVRKFSERSKKRKERLDKDVIANPPAKRVNASKGLYENTILGNPSYASVKDIIGDKYKTRRSTQISELVNKSRNISSDSDPKITEDNRSNSEGLIPATPPGQNLHELNEPVISSRSNEENDENINTANMPRTSSKVRRTHTAVNNRDKSSNTGDGNKIHLSQSDKQSSGDCCGLNREVVQEVCSKALEKLVSSLSQITQETSVYEDYESIPKQKILKMYEKRFKAMETNNGCSSSLDEESGVFMSFTSPQNKTMNPVLEAQCSSAEVRRPLTSTFGSLFKNKEDSPSPSFFKDVLWSSRPNKRKEELRMKKEVVMTPPPRIFRELRYPEHSPSPPVGWTASPRPGRFGGLFDGSPGCRLGDWGLAATPRVSLESSPSPSPSPPESASPLGSPRITAMTSPTTTPTSISRFFLPSQSTQFQGYLEKSPLRSLFSYDDQQSSIYSPHRFS